ncbi:MAG: 4-(cytidine 5'-diphospho)-2-C-methyl-D-erythritol kinase [Candidatus Marinimicrobia bacterium]|nr:4-(cytidine 5'-diphospho)-2-C-methyl-D-erythritol kinase [Candidatus Neomarinimicrobiota bacterium]
MTTILRSNSKINIGLRILGKRKDGYHLIETVFQEIDFSDEIIVENNGTGVFTIECNNKSLETDNNIIIKTAKLIKPLLPTNFGAHFKLKKNIPIGAGLGGGSANAAAVLKYLFNCFEKSKINDNDKKRLLLKYAAELGADVPFFLDGGTSYASGIGENLEKTDIPKEWFALLIIPKFSISTQWAYKSLNISLTDRIKNTILSSYLKNGFKWQFFENDFEKIIIPAYPQIGFIKERLEKNDAVFTSLSGSGSTVYGIFESLSSAKKAKSNLQEFGKAIIARPI